MKWIFFLFFFVFSTLLYSQDTSGKKKGDIYFKGFVGWKQDGIRLKNNQFKQEIYKVPTAIPYYKKGNSNLILSYSFLASGSILLFIYSQNQKHSSSNASGLLLTSFGLISGGIFTAIFSHHNFQKAVRTYNTAVAY